ncbi:hypothetical protein TNCV_1665941 [Trichonephila clavipes]|nr:hypothetical protein TNCV_1665941 [Trichonephila clavipes]
MKKEFEYTKKKVRKEGTRGFKTAFKNTLLRIQDPSRPSRDDSSVGSRESFHSDGSSAIDFLQSRKEPENKDA